MEYGDYLWMLIYGYWWMILIFIYVSLIFPNFIEYINYIPKKECNFNIHYLNTLYTYMFKIRKAYKGMEWNVSFLTLLLPYRKPNYVSWHSSRVIGMNIYIHIYTHIVKYYIEHIYIYSNILYRLFCTLLIYIVTASQKTPYITNTFFFIAAEYSTAWMCYYFSVKYLPIVWRANTIFHTYNIAVNCCGPSACRHLHDREKNFVEATIISDGIPLILLRKSTKQ